MPVTAAVLWYLVAFEPEGGLAMIPAPHQTGEQCQAALSEFQASNPSSTWDLHCLEPDE